MSRNGDERDKRRSWTKRREFIPGQLLTIDRAFADQHVTMLEQNFTRWPGCGGVTVFL